MTLKIEWHEVKAETVLRYFVDGFKVPVKHYDWFYDPTKGQFLLKVYVHHDPAPSTGGADT